MIKTRTTGTTKTKRRVPARTVGHRKSYASILRGEKRKLERIRKENLVELERQGVLRELKENNNKRLIYKLQSSYN